MTSAVCALTLGAGLAHAQQRTMAIYGDWTLSCAIGPDGKSCGLVQTQKIEGQADPVSQISVGRFTSAGPFKISIEVRANAWVPTGVNVVVGGKPALTATFKWCTNTRCLADADLSDADLRRLRGQRDKDQGEIAYKNALQGEVSIPMSFNGFGAALDALQKQ
jgi:invasion protein IalB